MNGYNLSRAWFEFAFENQDTVTGNHAAVYFWHVELANRMGWVEKFGSPVSQGMAATGIKSYNTYKKCFDQVVSWGFIKIIKPSVNQYQSNIVALSKFDTSLYKSLDESLTTHLINQSEITIQDTVQITEDINKQQTTNLETTNNKQQTYSSVGKNSDDDLKKGNGFFSQPKSESSEKKFDELETTEAIQPIEEKKEKPLQKVARKSSPKKDPEEYSIVHKMKLMITEGNEELNYPKPEVTYYWSVKDASNAKGLAAQIKFSIEQKNPGHEATDFEILQSLKIIIDYIPLMKSDYLVNWTIPTLNSQFNQIIKFIKSRQNGKPQQQSFNSHGQPTDTASQLSTIEKRIAERSAERRRQAGFNQGN